MNDGHRAESTRMPYWDYGQTALYFITICTHNKEHTLGKITNSTFTAFTAGEVVISAWFEIPEHFPFATLDRFCVMPNHIHGIIHIAKSAELRSSQVVPGETLHGVYLPALQLEEHRDRLAGRRFGKMQKGSLALVLNGFKAAVSRRCKIENIAFAWQDNYHDHIIRSEKEYHRICWYIENNVANWGGDTLNSNATTTIQFPEHLEIAGSEIPR